MVVGQLEIQLMANIARLQADMDQAKQVVGSSMKSITDAVDLAKKALIAFAGVASVNAFADMVRNNITAAASMGKLATQAGVTVEAMSGLTGVGKLSGTASETIAASMNKMTKAMSGTTEEGKGAGAALRALGLNFDDFQKMSPDERMLTTAKAMNQFQDGSGKSAVAMALMGKTGAEMLPYLKDLAEVGTLNAKVTTEQAAMAKDFDLNLKKVTVTSEAWKKEVSMGMLPALDDASVAFLGVMNGTGGLRDEIKKLSADGTIDKYVRGAVTVLTYFADIIEYVVRAVKIMGEGIGATIASIITQFSGLGQAVKLAMSGEFSAAGDALKTSFGASKDIVKDYGKSIIDTFGADTMGQKFRARMEDVKGLSAATAKAAAEANNLKPKLTDDFNQKLGGAGAYDPQIKAYEELIAKIREKTDADNLQTQMGRALTEAEKQQLEITKLVATGKISAAAASSELTKQLLKELDAAQLAKLIEESEKKQAMAIALERQKLNNQGYEEATKLFDVEVAQNKARMQHGKDTLEQIEFDTAALTLNTQQREIAVAMRDLEKRGIKEGTEAWTTYGEAIRAAITKKADLEKSVTDFKSIWDSVDKTAQATFTNIFNGGKNTFSKLRDTLKSTLLDLLYQMTVKKWVFDITASVSGAASGVAGSVAQSALGGGNSGIGGIASNLFSVGSSALGLSGVGTAFASGFSSAAAGLTPLIATSATTGVAVAGTTATGLAGGLGAALGAIGPAGWAALAAIAVFSIAGLTKKESASASTGSMERTYDASGNITSSKSPFAVGNGAEVVDGIFKQFKGLQDALGATGGAGFGYGAYSGTGNKNPMFRVTGGSFNSGETALNSGNLDLAASRAILSALQNSDMPKSLSKILNSVTVDTASLSQIQTVEMAAVNFANGIKAMSAAMDNLPFAQLKNMAFETAAALVDASGGLQNLSANLTSYQKDFYSAEEQRAQSVKDITKTLNKAGVNVSDDQIANMTREGYRALIEGMGAATEANAPMLAALYATSAEFAKITPAATAAAAATGTVATAIAAVSQTMQNLQANTANLQVSLLRAQGNTTGADAAQRSIDTTGYTAAEIAIYDYNRALQSQVDTLNAATAKAAQVAQEEYGLKTQLLQLQGNTTELRKRELAVLDPANRSIKKFIYALEDTAKAAAAASAAANESARQYFIGVDIAKNAAALNDQAASGIDKFFGTVAATSNAQLTAATAANQAAVSASAAWKSASDSIRSSLDAIKAQTAVVSGTSYASTLAQFQTLTVLAKGGDAASAGKLGGSAQAFLAASASQSKTLLDELRDRAKIESSLNDSLGNADAMKSAQDLIVIATQATVDQLKAANVTLSGFGSEVYKLLGGNYQGANRATAEAAAQKLANITADYQGYFAKTKEGDVTQYANGSSFKRLSGDMTQYTRADGSIEYLRASETALEIAKRLPEIAAVWQKQYGIILGATAKVVQPTPIGMPVTPIDQNYLWGTLSTPAFAAGGYHSGGVRLVGENGPELEVTGPSRIYNNQQTRSMMGGSSDEVVAAINRLDARLSNIEDNTRADATHNAKTARLLDRVTHGTDYIQTVTVTA